MTSLSNKSKILFLSLFILFLSAFGVFFLDFIGMINLDKKFASFRGEPGLSAEANDDEPSLIAREEFEKEKEKLQERIEDLDKREAMLTEKEKGIDGEKEKIDEVRKGLALEKKKLEKEKTQYSGYMKNVKKLAGKLTSMPPEEAVKIMVNWEETLTIDVLRQIDAESERAGKMSISSYLITLMPKDKASRIMYLMTQI